MHLAHAEISNYKASRILHYLFVFAPFVFLTAVLLLSCDQLTYSPDSTNENKMPPPQPVIFPLTFDNPTDTLLIYGEAKLQYHISTNGRQLDRINFYLNSELAGMTLDTTKITIDTYDYDDGMYQMTIEIIAKTGSGSLADKLEGEYYVTRYSVPVYIENKLPNPITISRMEAKDGSLHIVWPNVTSKRFKAYSVKCYSSTYVTIYNRDSTDIFYNYYVGGKIDLKVNILCEGKEIEGISRSFSDDGNKLISVTLDDNNVARIEWQKTKYYNNFRSYKVMTATGSIFDWGPPPFTYKIGEIFSADQTVYYDTIGFGGVNNYSVITTEISGNSFNDFQTNSLSVLLGNTIDIYIDNALYNPQLQLTYLDYNDDSRVINNNYDQVAQSSYCQFSFSSDYNKLFGVTPAWQYFDPSFSELDPNNLAIINEYKIRDFFDLSSVNFSNFSYLKSTCVMICLYDIPGPVILNYSNKDTTYINLNWGNYGGKIYQLSPNKNFVFISDFESSDLILFDISDLKFKKIKTLPSSYDKACFSNSGNEYILVENNKIITYDYPEGNQIAEITTGRNLSDPSLDPVSGYLGCLDMKHNEYCIYNLETGTLIKTVSLFNDDRQVNYTDKFFLVNSNLFYNYGQYIKVLN